MTMRRKLLVLIALLFTLTACTSSNVSSIQNVDAETFISKISGGNTLIIDVRTPEEYNSGHLKDALNLDVESGAFESSLVSLDKSASYALYCRSGRRATIAANLMAKSGFKSIINFNQGGFAELAANGAPTE